MSPAQAFRYSARRRALADRRRPTQNGPAPPGGRFTGKCRLCEGYHRQPDLRYECPRCGRTFCLGEIHAAGIGMTCPDCEVPLESGEEAIAP
jgi:DNA-directed RNA polymerase subunit RPC12/RpoP